MARHRGSLIYADGGVRIPSGAGAGKLAVSNASGDIAWTDPATAVPKTFRTVVPIFQSDGISTATGVLGKHVNSITTGQTVKLIALLHSIASGTRADFKIQKATVAGAYSDLTGFGTTAAPVQATTTEQWWDPADQTIADNTMLAVVVTSLTATPKGLCVSLVFEWAI